MSLAITHSTCGLRRPRLRPFSITSLAVLIPCESHNFIAPKSTLLESYVNIKLDVPTFDNTFRIAILGMSLLTLSHIEKLLEFFKYLFKTACVCCLLRSTFFESREREPKWIEAILFALLISVLLFIARHACSVVDSTLLFIAQGLIGFIYL